jgi:hypothetical protein
MDVTIPYTFYPSALPHWIAWVLFVAAIAGGVGAGIARGQKRGWLSGAVAGVVGSAGFLLATTVLSMVIAFFTHDV